MREHDLILHNGHVLNLDTASRTSEAIGVATGTVSALGTSSEMLAAPPTRAAARLPARRDAPGRIGAGGGRDQASEAPAPREGRKPRRARRSRVGRLTRRPGNSSGRAQRASRASSRAWGSPAT